MSYFTTNTNNNTDIQQFKYPIKIEEIPKEMKAYFTLQLHIPEQKTILLNNPEFKIMIDDYNKYGSSLSGEYKGIPWEMKKPYNTYWCGYIKFTDDESNPLLDDDCWNQLENIIHGGSTSGLGFDCAHVGDFPTTNGTFKTYQYVLDCIKLAIDFIDARKKLKN